MTMIEVKLPVKVTAFRTEYNAVKGIDIYTLVGKIKGQLTKHQFQYPNVEESKFKEITQQIQKSDFLVDIVVDVELKEPKGYQSGYLFELPHIEHEPILIKKLDMSIEAEKHKIVIDPEHQDLFEEIVVKMMGDGHRRPFTDGFIDSMLQRTQVEVSKNGIEQAEKNINELAEFLFITDNGDSYWNKEAATVIKVMVFSVFWDSVQEQSLDRQYFNTNDIRNCLKQVGDGTKNLDDYERYLPKDLKEEYQASAFSRKESIDAILTVIATVLQGMEIINQSDDSAESDPAIEPKEITEISDGNTEEIAEKSMGEDEEQPSDQEENMEEIVEEENIVEENLPISEMYTNLTSEFNDDNRDELMKFTKSLLSVVFEQSKNELVPLINLIVLEAKTKGMNYEEFKQRLIELATTDESKDQIQFLTHFNEMGFNNKLKELYVLSIEKYRTEKTDDELAADIKYIAEYIKENGVTE